METLPPNADAPENSCPSSSTNDSTNDSTKDVSSEFTLIDIGNAPPIKSTSSTSTEPDVPAFPKMVENMGEGLALQAKIRKGIEDMYRVYGVAITASGTVVAPVDKQTRQTHNHNHKRAYECGEVMWNVIHNFGILLVNVPVGDKGQGRAETATVLANVFVACYFAWINIHRGLGPDKSFSRIMGAYNIYTGLALQQAVASVRSVVSKTQGEEDEEKKQRLLDFPNGTVRGALLRCIRAVRGFDTLAGLEVWADTMRQILPVLARLSTITYVRGDEDWMVLTCKEHVRAYLARRKPPPPAKVETATAAAAAADGEKVRDESETVPESTSWAYFTAVRNSKGRMGDTGIKSSLTMEH